MYQTGMTMPTPQPPANQSQYLETPSPPHLQTQAQHLDPYDTDAASILAPSTISPNNPSSRNLLHHPEYSSSTIRAASICSSTAPIHPDATPQSQRRATVSYLAELRAARAPFPKPKKTKGRTAFELLGSMVDVFVPIDIDAGKTSMKQSSLGKALKKVERVGSVGHGHGHGNGGTHGGHTYGHGEVETVADAEERRSSVAI